MSSGPREAEQQRQEIRGLRHDVGRARDAAEWAEQEAERARKELQEQEMQGRRGQERRALTPGVRCTWVGRTVYCL